MDGNYLFDRLSEFEQRERILMAVNGRLTEERDVYKEENEKLKAESELFLNSPNTETIIEKVLQTELDEYKATVEWAKQEMLERRNKAEGIWTVMTARIGILEEWLEEKRDELAEKDRVLRQTISQSEWELQEKSEFSSKNRL